MIKLIKISVFMLALPSIVVAAPAGWRPLLEANELAGILQDSPDVRVIRVTGNYGRGHIPSSLESPYADWRGSGDNPGELRGLDEYTALLQSLGITGSSAVAVVHQGSDPGDMGAATRVYWTLKSLGITDVAIINGGFEAWREARLPVSSSQESTIPSNYRATWHNDWRATTEDVEALVQSGEANLVDARPASFFRGLRASIGRPGTIRGAGNLEYESWFDGDRLRAGDELSTVFAGYGAPESPVTVSFCNTGHWASINWFVMSELLAVENTRLYAESVGEWGREERPMDNQAGRGKIYTDLTTRWFKDLFGN